MAHKSIARALVVPCPAWACCAAMLRIRFVGQVPCVCHVVTKCSVKRTTKSALNVGTDVGGVLQLSFCSVLLFLPSSPLASYFLSILLFRKHFVALWSRSLIAQLLHIQLLSYLSTAVYTIDWLRDVIKYCLSLPNYAWIASGLNL